MINTDDLISAEGLKYLITNKVVQIVDCRFDLFDVKKGRRDYLAGHIPSSVYADMDTDLSGELTEKSGRHPLPDIDTFRDKLENWGISDDTHVVTYDQNNGSMAVRLWWMLRHWLGHPGASVLDGGFTGWREAGYELEIPTNLPSPGCYTRIPNPLVVATTEEISTMIGAGQDLTLIDAREGARFRGEIEPVDSVGGHIPGSRNFPLTTNIAKDGKLLATPQLKENWSNILGDGESSEAVVMCGSGVTACHLALSADLAGMGTPKLYVGSWSEWIRDSARPIAVGDEPDF